MKKIIICIVTTIVSILFLSCQNINRNFKSINSSFNGLNRTAVLMDYDGDTIKMWKGNFDIRDIGADNQIFFDIDGKRVWIQGGIFISEEK